MADPVDGCDTFAHCLFAHRVIWSPEREATFDHRDNRPRRLLLTKWKTTFAHQEMGPLSTQNLFNLLHIHRRQAKKLLEALKIFFSYQVLIFFNIFYWSNVVEVYCRGGQLSLRSNVAFLSGEQMTLWANKQWSNVPQPLIS